MKPFDTHTPEINAAMQDLQQRTLTLELAGLEAVLLHGLMQLAIRHPNLPDTSRGVAMLICARLKQGLATDERLLPILNAGEDVRQDEAPMKLPEVVTQPGQVPAMYALFVEEADGESIVYARANNHPIVSFEPHRIPEMRELMHRAAATTGLPARLVRFFGRDVIEEVNL